MEQYLEHVTWSVEAFRFKGYSVWESHLEIITCYYICVWRNPERRWLRTQPCETPSFRECNEESPRGVQLKRHMSISVLYAVLHTRGIPRGNQWIPWPQAFYSCCVSQNVVTWIACIQTGLALKYIFQSPTSGLLNQNFRELYQGFEFLISDSHFATQDDSGLLDETEHVNK